MSVPAASALALWGAAYTAGTAADDVLTAISGFGLTAGVRRDGPAPDGSSAASIPGPGEAPAGPAALLPLLRSGAPSLVLPRPGDVRGLPVPAGPATASALRAGAAVVLFEVGVTIVPIDGLWRIFAATGRPVNHELLPAREELDAAVRRATELFVTAELGVQAAAARQQVSDFVHQHSMPLPPGMPARAVALLDRCIQLEALLAVIGAHRTAAVNGHQLDQVAAVLGPLGDAARNGRAAAVNLAIAELLAARPRPDLIPDRSA
ncbi:hypothetical protein [Nakamurella lactea]|uniref:hypothetical protein n=1 Tax=Nakamurella lactea TaxID=459515 RepID=UPI000425D2F4|nr:hypothetical protein [Nakamurella lactea]